jgi:hypothetical protein
MEHSMADAIRNIGGLRVQFCATEGAAIAREADALDLIAATYGQEVDWIALPAERLARDFFDLRTGLAGAVLQKLTNYGLRVAILGDLGRETAASKALADFLRESNRGTQVWFLRDEAELEARLAARS